VVTVFTLELTVIKKRGIQKSLGTTLALIKQQQQKNTNSGDKHCELSHFYKLDVSYAIQHTFSRVISFPDPLKIFCIYSLVIIFNGHFISLLEMYVE